MNLNERTIGLDHNLSKPIYIPYCVYLPRRYLSRESKLHHILVIRITLCNRTSTSGGARDGEHSDTSPFPGYTCEKRQNILEYFCHLTVKTTKTVYLVTLYLEV